MIREFVQFASNARFTLSRDEHCPKELYERMPEANRIFIMTYNVSPEKRELLDLLTNARKATEIRIITSVPNRFPFYYSSSAGENARKAARKQIQAYISQLQPSRFPSVAKIYFLFGNHAKVFVVDDLVYIGSANFSDESSKNIETGIIIQDDDFADDVVSQIWESIASHAIAHPDQSDGLRFWSTELLESTQIPESLSDPYEVTSSNEASWTQDELRRRRGELLASVHLLRDAIEGPEDERTLQAFSGFIRNYVNEPALNTIESELTWNRGDIERCLAFSYKDVVDRHVAAMCSDEEMLSSIQEDGAVIADEEWERLLKAAEAKMVSVIHSFEKERNKLKIAIDEYFARKIDNT